MKRKSHAFALVFLLLALSSVGGQPGDIRCETDVDCAVLGEGYICKDNVCAMPTEQPAGRSVQVVECPEGFIKDNDGNCIPASVPDGNFCKDSDGMINFLVKGTVSQRVSPESPVQKFTDFCVGDMLHEYYCDDIGPEKFDCRSSNQICDDGRCVYPEGTEPFFDGIKIVEYGDYSEYFGDVTKARLIADPKVFDQEMIIEYTDIMYPDFPNEWKKIRPYDQMLCYARISNPDPESEIKVNMELWDIGENKKIQQKKATCETHLYQNDCYAGFDSTHDLVKADKISDDRARKLYCKVEIESRGKKIDEAKSNELLVARYIYPIVTVGVEGNKEELRDFNIKIQYDYYRTISELEDSLQEEFANPELSSKLVLYGFGQEVGGDKVLDNRGSFNFNHFTNLFSALKFDPNKLDRILVYSNFILETYNNGKAYSQRAAGFTKFNFPIVYIGKVWDISIVAHEIGHAKPISLCDEYNINYWTDQNKEQAKGCPNPFPKTAPNKEKVNSLLSSPMSPIKELLESGGSVSVDDRFNTVSIIALPMKGSMCQIERKSNFLSRLLGGDQGFVFSDPEGCMEMYVDKILEAYGHMMDISSHYADGIQVSLTFVLKEDLSLSTSIMGGENAGNYYPEVTHSRNIYCPLKNC